MKWIFEAICIGLLLGIAVAYLFYQVDRLVWPDEPMRVLSAVEAIDRGWAMEFEE
jgi:hypothetical protein